MAYEEAFAYLEEKGYGDRVSVFDVSSATVELAALAVGTEPARIAKSLSFLVNEKPAKASLAVKAGDIIEIQFGMKSVKVEVLDVTETVKKDDAKDLYRYL